MREVNDIVTVRQQTRQWAGEVGLSLVDQTKIVTAASELARNVVVYGGGGSVRLELLENGVRKGLRLIFADQGGVGTALAGRLAAVGHDAVLVWPGEGYEQTAVNKYQLHPSKPDQFRRLLRESDDGRSSARSPSPKPARSSRAATARRARWTPA